MSRSRVAYLATIAPDGQPDLVPITFALVDPDTICTAVDHKPKTTRELRRLANIERDGRVTLLVDRYEDAEWSKLWWCRLRGTARIVEDGPAFDLAIQALTAKYEQYRRTRLQGPVIEIAVTGATGWTAVR